LKFLKKVLGNNPSNDWRVKLFANFKDIEEKEKFKDEYKETTDTLLALSEYVETPKDKLTLVSLMEYFSLKKNIETIFEWNYEAIFLTIKYLS